MGSSFARKRKGRFFRSLVITKSKTESTEAVDMARRSIIANQLGGEPVDGSLTSDLIVEYLTSDGKDPDAGLTLDELFGSIDQSEYQTLSAHSVLSNEDKIALFDLDSRVDSPIEYCQLDDGKWSVRLKLRNATPIAGIGKTLADAVKRVDITLRLVPRSIVPCKPTAPQTSSVGLFARVNSQA